MADLLANVAQLAITPPLGVHLLEPRGAAATGVYDDLYVRALAFSDGATRIAIVTLDLLGLDPELNERVQRAISVRTGLPAENLMIAASHTHSAPVTIAWDHAAQPQRDRGWEAVLAEKAANCVAQALENPVPVRLAAGRAPAQVGFNRRISSPDGTRMANNPAGPVAPWVDVLRVDRADDGRPLAVLFSHAAHPVTVHVADTRFSADYPGAAAERIRGCLDRNVVAMFAQGCGADINVDPLAKGYAEARRKGALLGDAVVEAAMAAEPVAVGQLRTVVRDVALPFEPFRPGVTEAILARAQESYAAVEAQGGSEAELNDQRELLYWAQKMKCWVESADPPRGLPLRVQGFGLGQDLAVVGLQHEMFVEYQLFLQQNSPIAHTLVFGYTNGCADYVPTAAALALGGYEVQGGPKEYGMPSLTPDCEAIVKEAGLSVLQELRDSYR